jgi:hypothetical protein
MSASGVLLATMLARPSATCRAHLYECYAPMSSSRFVAATFSSGRLRARRASAVGSRISRAAIASSQIRRFMGLGFALALWRRTLIISLIWESVGVVVVMPRSSRATPRPARLNSHTRALSSNEQM